jgi:hypothetical protein
MHLQREAPNLRVQNRDCPGIEDTTVLCDAATQQNRLAYAAISARVDW